MQKYAKKFKIKPKSKGKSKLPNPAFQGSTTVKRFPRWKCGGEKPSGKAKRFMLM